MDHKKTGQLIAELRKEQNLTQAALSELLHVSDRTISKWERGAGCPDILLLKKVSAIFHVPMEQLLDGDLNRKNQDNGNMKRMKFYVCPACGNIMWSTQGAEINCCGRRMEALIQNQESINYTMEEMDGEYFLSIPHEMRKDHYLSFVAVVSSDRFLFIKLYPEQAVELRIPFLRGKCQLYVYCTKHGLYQSDITKRKS